MATSGNHLSLPGSKVLYHTTNRNLTNNHCIQPLATQHNSQSTKTSVPTLNSLKFLPSSSVDNIYYSYIFKCSNNFKHCNNPSSPKSKNDISNDAEFFNHQSDTETNQLETSHKLLAGTTLAAAYYRLSTTHDNCTSMSTLCLPTSLTPMSRDPFFSIKSFYLTEDKYCNQYHHKFQKNNDQSFYQNFTKSSQDFIFAFILKCDFSHYCYPFRKITLMDSMNQRILYIFFLLLISFTSRCNTHQLSSSSSDVNHQYLRSLTGVTTTEHTKINPSYTLNDYNKAILHAFNSPRPFCGDPPLVPNAQSNLHLQQKHFFFPVGQEANYECKQGFKAVGGSSETRCVLDIPIASHVIFPDVFQPNPNPVRQGPNRSKNSKRLSDLDEEPDLNSSGQRSPFPNDFNDKRKMSRKTDDDLYDLENRPNAKKQYAHWYPPVTLNCQMVNCTDPGQVEHAKRNDSLKSGTLSFNSNVHYVCEDGYETIGFPILTCRPDGTWNRAPPQCRLKQCPVLPELKNGHIVYSDSNRRTNSRADYYCDPGHRLNAATSTRLCGPNDKWSLLEPMLYPPNVNTTNSMNDSYQCLPVTCSTPISPHNGLRVVDVNRKQRINKNVFIPGDIIIYSCVSNRMKLTAKCNPDGEWSQRMPHCPMNEFSSLKCAPITSFTHGSVKVEQNKAFFSCNEGYELDGGNTITCNPNGVWSWPLPRCVIRMTLPQAYSPTTLNPSHSSNLTESESLEKQKHSISKTLLILLIVIFIVLLIVIGIVMVAFYRWRQRRLNSKTWQRYFGHYYHRQSKTNIVLSTHFSNNHLNKAGGATIGSTGSSNINASACLLQRSIRSHSKAFPKSDYLQSSFSSADENTADVKSFTTETGTSDRARTISTYVDDTCPEDDEYDEDDVSIYKSTTFPISAKQHNSLPLDILSASSMTNNHNENNAAKRTFSSGNDPLCSNMQQPSPIIVKNNFSRDKLFNNGIPVTDL